MTHSGRQRLTRMRPSWSHILKHDLYEKRTWCQSTFQALCSRTHCRRSRRWFAMRGILYKGTIAHNPRRSRRQRIDEADISTHVAVYQCAVKCSEEAVRSCTTMRSRCQL
ncbi:uncharacterized protein TNCV_2396131 [Trichonephila clavipes]|uniref:Uncharacterized protein n=1 Tax=Trichonephila clavipes TaxID=2585209 RepID=A0A8X6VR46_TRICX|nr:uncharacterized protein TNCV_2396131 [Trichonephila clavipes]